MSNSIVCPYCKESIEATAVKCKNCLEFLPEFKKSDSQPRKFLSEPLIGYLFGVIGKSLVPLTILILALAYKPILEVLLVRTKQAEFLGTKISFSETKAYTGNLTPVELYYFIGSATNYPTPRVQWNYEALHSEKHDEVIKSLANKGLVDYSIKENPDNKFFTKEIVVTPTEQGKNFLIELGLSFNGKTFFDAP